MQLQIKTGLLLLCLTKLFSVQGQNLHISLLNEIPVKSVTVSSLKGTYQIIGDSALLMTMDANEAMYITIFEQRLLLHPLYQMR